MKPTQENAVKVYNELNAELKAVRSLEELKVLIDKAYNDAEYTDFNISLESKRSGKVAFDFSKLPYGSRVLYLYDDTVSYGKSHIENLYKHLHFQVWYQAEDGWRYPVKK